MRKQPSTWLLLACLLTAAALAGCRTKQADFERTTFLCNSRMPDSQCGTASDGSPMTCFSGEQLGGQAFCAERCQTETAGETVDGLVCLGSRAKLRACRPSATDPEDGACPGPLSCYRTDLMQDEGVCMAIELCSDNSDCKSLERSTCASTVMKQAYPAAQLKTDKLHCLLEGCQARGADCPPGETCLRKALPNTPVPDICVPHCDSSLNCPPNFYCLRKVSGRDSPNICLPGVIGFRCSTSLDCLAGECLETGLGFSICGVPCQRHDDCMPYFNVAATYCLETGTAGKHCVNPRPLAGAACLSDDVCPKGQVCAHETVYGRTTSLGECRTPCDAEERCPARLGLGHVCLKLDKERTCYPGRFGMPCAESSDCAPTLGCHPVAPDERGPVDGTYAWASGRICTVPCETDADCDASHWTEKEGFCEAGFCRLGGGPNDRCGRNAQCRSGECVKSDAAWGRCGPGP